MAFTKKSLFFLLLASLAMIQTSMAGDPDILTDFIVPPNSPPPDGNFFTFTGMRVGEPGPHPPRSAELLFLAQGSLEVGFVDTTNKLYTQTLQAGDVFVFPKGLVHFQYNADAKTPALAISAFGSANAGTVSLPNTLFNSTIDDSVLALSFKTDVATIQKLKAGLKG
ncbi:UNVERIFIED_CONTAM: Germin-like protein 9-3 [Sesamum latifolium]|uniref:Germin-like protein n=1 Tax=Sesamum latifolium TaxID=2727402 RepID=A0AAW2Y323_9LAMI